MRAILSLLVAMCLPVMLLAEPKGVVNIQPNLIQPNLIQPNLDGSASSWMKFEFAEQALIVIPVFVNDSGPYRFLLDTGAAMSVLATRVADKLNIRNGRTGSLSSAAGPVRVDIRRIETVQIGDVQIKGPEIAVANFPFMGTLRVDGILGNDYLRSFIVSINYPKRVLRIERA